MAYMLLSSMVLFTFPVEGNTCSSSSEVVDLDVDSDNDNGMDLPDRSEYEDSIEEIAPGKYIFVNDDDDDNNYISDKDQEGSIQEEDDLVQMILELGTIPGRRNVQYKLEYPTRYICIWRSPKRGLSASGGEVVGGEWYTTETWILGDMDGDGNLDNYDIDPFNLALYDPNEYINQYGFNPDIVGDMNGDGTLNERDMDLFIHDLVNYCYRHVPLYLWIEGIRNSTSDVVLIHVDVDFNNDSSIDDFDSVRITVLDAYVEPELIINVADNVNESESFQIKVTTDGVPVENAEVVFNDQLKYTNQKGNVLFVAPSVTSDTEYEIEASMDGYATAMVTITIKNIVSPVRLDITAPLEAQEGQHFQVSVTSDGISIENVQIRFNNQTMYTNEEGKVTYTAPYVDQDKEYLITAEKEGYDSAFQIITITNEEPEVAVKGWIFGTIYALGSPLKAAKVCAFLSNEEYKCIFTDENGLFILSVSAGTYNITASKQGYTTSIINNVEVKEKSATERNFILEKKQVTTYEIDNNIELIENTIQEKVLQGKIGAEISINLDQKIISYYSELLAIKLESTKDKVSFTIAAPDDTTGTTVVTHIRKNVLSDPDAIRVTYDGDIIEEFTEIEAFFDLSGNTELGWIELNSKTDSYIFIRVPQFSEHTITITSLSEVIEGLGGTIAIIFYILFSLIAVVVFLSRVFTHPVYYNYFRKKKSK